MNARLPQLLSRLRPLVAGALLLVPAAARAQLIEVRGEACPPGQALVTFEEAATNRDALCGRMGQWDIARLAGGGSMDGPGYQCKIRPRDNRQLGNAWCRPMSVPPPPPGLVVAPPPAAAGCMERRGPFAWNCAGPIANMACTQINEPADPDTWNDNFLCAHRDLGLRWSYAGPIPGMRCTQVNEPAEPANHTWNDNFLCVPEESRLQLRWSYAGAIPGMQCIHFNEPADPHTWNDNYLCWNHEGAQFQEPPPPPPPPPLPPPPPPAGSNCMDRRGPLAWNCAGPIANMACTQINEPADPDTWNDNFLCAERDLGIRWSYAGPIPGMRCTQVNEPAEPLNHTWNDNFVCVPPQSPLQLRWSYAGPIPGMHCLRFHEPADPHTWNDNFLCWTR